MNLLSQTSPDTYRREGDFYILPDTTDVYQEVITEMNKENNNSPLTFYLGHSSFLDELEDDVQEQLSKVKEEGSDFIFIQKDRMEELITLIKN